jgi:hypothetical protein
MPITLTINGETAEQILSELQTLAGALTEPSYTYQLKTTTADPVGRALRALRDPPNDPVILDVVSDAPINPEDNAVVIEDKPKRKRRTKEEMEAERAAGLPPQEGDPDLGPNEITYWHHPESDSVWKHEGWPEFKSADEQLSHRITEAEYLEFLEKKKADDIMSDVVAEPQAEAEEKPAVIRREDLQTLVGKIIRNRKLSPAELKQAYIDIGGAPQLAAIDGAHMEALYNHLAEKLQA